MIKVDCNYLILIGYSNQLLYVLNHNNPWNINVPAIYIVFYLRYLPFNHGLLRIRSTTQGGWLSADAFKNIGSWGK